MQLYSIASGSSGNCIYVGTKESGILVDVGISKKRICEGLEREGFNLECIKAILITHEHIDHVSGLGPILRKVPIPVSATRETIDAIWKKGNMAHVDEDLFHAIVPEQPFQVADIQVMPVPISHDAANPVCYTLQGDNQKIGIATDTGCYTADMVEYLRECNALLLEANHDINLLQVGKYPYSLKMRILGEKGHLSNDASARFLQELWSPKLQHIVLGHLSEENNFPELAYNTVTFELEQNAFWSKQDIELLVAHRRSPSKLITI